MFSNSKFLSVGLLASILVQFYMLSVIAAQETPHNVNGSNNKQRIFRRVVLRQPNRSTERPSVSTGVCECMDYWACVMKNGQVHSYCGLGASEVCCFHKKGVNKVISNNNSSSDKNNNGPSSEKIILSEETITTTPALASTEDKEELFTTGNENSDDFISVSTTPSSTSPLSSSTTPDIDYFYMLENGESELIRGGGTQAQDEDTTIINGSNNDNDEVECGKQVINWKLDSKAEIREWPWHVALLEVNQDMYVCGGTLISPDKVLSAAHCLKSCVKSNAPKLKIRAGEYDISANSETDPYVEVLVEKIIMHPNFNNATLVNDIAILKLERPLNYALNIRPLCLHSHDKDCSLIARLGGDTPVRQSVVTGWGRPSENSPFSVLMKEIVVPLWNHTQCQAKLQRNFGASYELPKTAICAGERGHDACDGDEGGGLPCFSSQRHWWELVGIVSFGIGCGDRVDTPGVYTSVFPYVQWIDAFNYLQ